MIDLLRVVAAWGIVFYHSNYSVMHHVTLDWLPFVRDGLFGWALPFFYATSAYSILTYLQSGMPRWKLWFKYVIHLLILMVIYQLVRIVGMHQAVFPCTSSLTCWFEVVRTGNHSIGYYLYDWLLFYIIAWISIHFHRRLGPILLLIIGVGLLVFGINPLFERQVALWSFTLGIGLFLLLSRFPQPKLTKNQPFFRHISYWIYLLHPFIYMVTDRFIPKLLQGWSANIVGLVIILVTIGITTAISIVFERWRTNHRSSV
jgi:peptidoglycan/LPS O-acetylase OafA/YrhL